MKAMLTVPAEEKKTVAVVLTFGQHAWLKSEAERKSQTVSMVARGILEKAMRESQAEPQEGKVA